MSSKRSKVHPKYKTKYRVRNWPAYDYSLVARGDVTLWITPEALDYKSPIKYEQAALAATEIPSG